MKIEISIDCVDDTGRIPKGQIITWTCIGLHSRDAKIRRVANAIAKALRETYPKPGKTNKPGGRSSE